MSRPRIAVASAAIVAVATIMIVLLAAPMASAAASSAGASVRASGTLTAHLVIPARFAPRAARRGMTVPLRVRNPAGYRRAKVAAGRALAAWQAARRFSSPFAPLAPGVVFSAPGLAATSLSPTPPDTTGAIGPDSYVEFVNSQVAVYGRDTLTPLATASQDDFSGGSSTCDGQIKWDQTAQRFEYWDLDCGLTNGFQFGWSKTASPLPLSGPGSNWCSFHVDAGTTIEDYGKLGNNDNFMILGANQFDGVTGLFSGAMAFVIPKPVNGSTDCPATVTAQAFTLPSDVFTPVPANIFGSSATGYIAASSINSSDTLYLFRVSGTGSPTIDLDSTVTVPAYDIPANIPQPGSTDQLDSSDTRLTQANAANDPAINALGIWTQHTVAGPGGGPSVVRWYELAPGHSTPVQTGTISAGSEFAFNGAIAPSASGSAAAIDYNVGGSDMLVQVRAQTHPAGASAGTAGGEQTIATSSGINADFSCPSTGSGSISCRWGDYAGASTDPASTGCTGSVWGTNELNGTPDALNDATWESENFSIPVSQCLPPASVTVALSPPTIRADGSSTSTATATVKDAAGHGVAGQQVTFASSDPRERIGAVSDQGNGSFSATITSSTTVGSVTITATDVSASPVLSGHATLVQTSPPRPAVSRTFLSGTGKRNATLGLTVASTAGGPSVRTVAIALPSGLSFARAMVAARRQLTVTTTGGTPVAYSASVNRGVLVISPRVPGQALRLKISSPAISVSRSFAAKVRRHAVSAVKIGVLVTDSLGRITPAALNVRLT